MKAYVSFLISFFATFVNCEGGLNRFSNDCQQAVKVAVAQDKNLRQFANSKIEWELLPTGEVFPCIKTLLKEFSKLDVSLQEQLNDELRA